MKLVSKIPALVFLGSSLLLSGCGGGGGGGDDPRPSSTLTSANADDVAAGMLATSDFLNSEASTGGDLVTGAAVLPIQKTNVMDATIQHLYRAFEAKPSYTVTGVSGEKIEPCEVSGSYTIFFDVADTNADTPSNGDVVTLTYKNCVEGDGTKINGSVRTAFSNITGTPGTTTAWSATTKLTFTSFSLNYGDGTDELHGDMTLTYSQTGSGEMSYSASGNSFRFSSDYDDTAYFFVLSSYDFDGAVSAGNLYTYSSDFKVSGDIPDLGNNVAYTTKTLTEFERQDFDNPHQGVMTVTATDSTSLKITVLSATQVQLELDTNADGTIDETKILLWDELLALT